MNPAATTMSATATRAPFSYLVIEHEPSRERGEHDEQYVQVDEKTRGVAGATAATHRGLNRLAAEDDKRDPERKREQRQQNGLAENEQQRSRERLAGEDCGRRGRRHEHRLERALLTLGGKGASKCDEARKD